jgi:hypothetical protein
MNHMPQESSLRFLTASELAAERRRAVEDAKPKCTCPATIVIEGVEYTHKPGHGIVDFGCLIHGVDPLSMRPGAFVVDTGQSVERIVGSLKGKD